MRSILRAYPTLLRVGLAAAIAYRAELVIWLLTTTMPIVSLALWTAVAETGPVGRLGTSEITAYFLAALVVRQLTGSWLVWEMNQDIKSGALAQRLLKPIHPLVGYSAENLAAVPLRALLAAPIAAIAIAATGGAHLPDSALALALWLPSLLGAWLINFFTMALAGSLAFRIESSTFVFDLWLMAFMILSGYVVPIELFPGVVQEVARVLPFRYALGFPTELVTGLIDEGRVLRELGVQWAWVAACAAAGLAAWRSGVRRFAAYGG